MRRQSPRRKTRLQQPLLDVWPLVWRRSLPMLMESCFSSAHHASGGHFRKVHVTFFCACAGLSLHAQISCSLRPPCARLGCFLKHVLKQASIKMEAAVLHVCRYYEDRMCWADIQPFGLFLVVGLAVFVLLVGFNALGVLQDNHPCHLFRL